MAMQIDTLIQLSRRYLNEVRIRPFNDGAMLNNLCLEQVAKYEVPLLKAAAFRLLNSS
jgi:hypothetical protein